ncbi:MAG: response regulator [Planctomycetes bacterium]|nr:response regulator [Planctomycetota bacterium]
MTSHPLDAHTITPDSLLRSLTEEVRSLEARLATLEGGDEDAGRMLSEEAALMALRTRSRFLLDLTRRARTPLTGALGMLELLQETKLTKKQQTYVEEALQSSRSLLRVFTEILDYFQIESGDLVLEEDEFDLVASVTERVESFRDAAEERGVSLCFTPAEGLPRTLRSDRSRFARVLTELIENALQHTTVGVVQVGAQLVDPTQPRGALLFWVSDTGCGIEAERLTSMFDLWNHDESKGNVLAIGLPAAKTLVQAMGGRMDIESEPGEGTTVRFTLPQPRELRPIEALAFPPAHGALGGEGSERRPARVLVVEDDRVNQRVAMGFLAKSGYESTGARDGREALEMLRAGSYDAVLMDCAMPELDGYQTTRAIRDGEVPGCEPIPIIALTAEVSTQARRGCLEAGMNDYLTKPIRREELDHAIRAWLPMHLRPARKA